jgi:hypothetical protein
LTSLQILCGLIIRGPLQMANPGIAVVALTQALTEFGEASGFTLNEDNTVSWTDDYGIGAVFLPSGLGYFNNPSPIHTILQPSYL